MIKVHILKVDMSVNSANKLGYPKYLLLLKSTWEDSCENRLSFLNEQDIISCYPCQIAEYNTYNKKDAWKIQVRGEEEPIYCLATELDSFLKITKRLKKLEKAFIALSKEDEKAKEFLSLEIEKNRVVDIIRAKLVDFNKLNRAEHSWRDDGKLSPVEYYNEGIVPYCQLTKDEYNLLVNAIGIRDLDEEVGIYD